MLRCSAVGAHQGLKGCAVNLSVEKLGRHLCFGKSRWVSINDSVTRGFIFRHFARLLSIDAFPYNGPGTSDGARPVAAIAYCMHSHVE